MKTNRIIAVVALALIGATTFIACNKVEKTQSSSVAQPNLSAKSAMSMSLTPGNAGYYHNESLRLTQDLWGQGGGLLDK